MTKKPQFMTPRQIIELICESADVSVKDVQGKCRTKGLCYARQYAMLILRENTPLSYSEIGKLLGNRDHSTALHGVRVADARRAAGTYPTNLPRSVIARLEGGKLSDDQRSKGRESGIPDSDLVDGDNNSSVNRGRRLEQRATPKG